MLMRTALTSPARRRLLARLLAACLLGAGLPAMAQEPGWAQVDAPTDGPPRAIGQTNNGCIAGARALPLEGTGYQVMHIERNRYYGHPQLVQTIESLGQKAAARGVGLLQIGDLGQPRGGPMAFGHRSHQTGLDVDIWFNLDPRVYADANLMRSNINAPSMLNAAKTGLNRAAWKPAHITLLELAAKLPAVDRIFVNPYVKKELCERVEGDQAWLRKIRPWFYHDDHFHLRVACPNDSPACAGQEPIPEGTGCDASLDWWFGHLPATPSHPPPPKPRLPQECREILAAP